MTLKCDECKGSIPDNRGYARIFYTGTPDNLIISEHILGGVHRPKEVDRPISDNWLNICIRDTPRPGSLQRSHTGLEGPLYGLHSDCYGALKSMFGVELTPDDKASRRIYQNLSRTILFLNEARAFTLFPNSAQKLKKMRQKEEGLRTLSTEISSFIDTLLPYIGAETKAEELYCRPPSNKAFPDKFIDGSTQMSFMLDKSLAIFDGIFTLGKILGKEGMHAQYHVSFQLPQDHLKASLSLNLIKSLLSRADGNLRFNIDFYGHHNEYLALKAYMQSKDPEEVKKFLVSVKEMREKLKSVDIKSLEQKVLHIIGELHA